MGNSRREVFAAAKKTEMSERSEHFLIDLSLSKSVVAEVSQKNMATSDHP